MMQNCRNKAIQTEELVEDEWEKVYAEMKLKSEPQSQASSARKNPSPIISIEQPFADKIESKYIETDNALLLR